MFWFTRCPIQIRTPDLGLGFSTFARGLSSAGCGKGCTVQTHSFNHHSLPRRLFATKKGSVWKSCIPKPRSSSFNHNFPYYLAIIGGNQAIQAAHAMLSRPNPGGASGTAPPGVAPNPNLWNGSVGPLVALKGRERYGGFLSQGGTPKSSIFAGFSLINHPAIGVPPF